MNILVTGGTGGVGQAIVKLLAKDVTNTVYFVYRNSEDTANTIENNVRALVERFEKEGLSVEKYLPACIKHSQLFYQSPNTIEKHIKALIFIKKNRYLTLSKDEIIEKIMKSPVLLCLKNETNYAPLLRTKMFNCRNIPKSVSGSSQINQKLSEYLKENPNSKFSFTIINDEMSQEFIDYAKNLGIIALDRDDVFDIKIK